MKYSGLELLEKLSLLFGPSSCEGEVADFIVGQIEGDCDSYTRDRLGNVIAKVSGRGIEYNAESPKKVMICAHMDEVGFMISDITEDGYLKFMTIGGISPAVLLDKRVIIGEGDKRINGIISSKAIHMQSVEERTKVTPIDKMYIDIGASSEAEAREYVEIGTVGVFDSDFERFGAEDKLIKGKALDDRLGCTIMIDLMRQLHASHKSLEYDVYFAFTCCEEIGISGAVVAAANTICPDAAIVLESTAVSDIYGVPESSSVAKLGDGGVISLMDRSTIYDRNMVEIALSVAEMRNIKAQIKRYVSGGNDSANIQRSGKGVKVLALSAPSRYIHSASNVVHADDIEAMRELVYALVAGGKL